MGILALTEVLRNRNLNDDPPGKFVLAAIAWHVNNSDGIDGLSWPSIASIANLTGYSTRTVERAIDRLESRNPPALIIYRAQKRGPGHSNRYRISVSNTVTESVSDSLTVTDSLSTNTVTESEKYRQSDGLTVKKQKNRNSKKREADERSKHPAIEMVRSITKRFPSEDVWDRIIQAVGEHPNEQLFKTSFVNWRSHDYKPTNLTWLFEAAQSSEPWVKEQRYAQNFRDQRQDEAIKERNFSEGLRRKRSAGKEDPAKLLGSGDTDRFGQLPPIEFESDISGKTFPG